MSHELRLSVASGAACLACSTRGTGPALVFLHAGVADRRSFATTLPGWTSVTWDRRGFGETTADPEPYDPVVDLLAVLDAVGAADAVLVGNSQGGRIAIDAALAHPERVRGLVLVAPAVGGAPEREDPPAIRALDAAIEAAEAAGDLATVNRLEVWCWLDGPLAPEGRIGGPARELLLRMNRQALGAPNVGDERQPPAAWPRLATLTVPVRVIVGTFDLPHVLANARHVARTVRNGELVVWDGVGHLPSLECPERLDAEIAAFLANI